MLKTKRLMTYDTKIPNVCCIGLLKHYNKNKFKLKNTTI